jgi:hypothetical protein
MRAHAELRCFPSVDETFTEHVYATASRLSSATSVVSPDALEERVRVTYPRAVVHPQTTIAMLNPGAQVWYVFRDGDH